MGVMPVSREEPEAAEEAHVGPEEAREPEGHDELAAGGDDDGMGAEEEHRRPRVLRNPGQPTESEIEEHNATHIPYRPWCEACNRGRAKKKPSLRLCGAYSHSEHARVRMDYAKLTEVIDDEVEDGQDGDEVEGAENSQTMLVMQESQHTSVWSYAVERKGASEEWLVPQLLDDLETVGLQEDRVVAKSDQEPSVVEVIREVVDGRQAAHGTAVESSAVGESDTNATVERAIQDVEGQIRTLRAGLEARLREKVHIRDPVVPWLIRHAGCLITMCRVRPNGKTALEMIKGRRTHMKITEFGEHVLFRIPTTRTNPGKFEDRYEAGIYLGFDVRSMESYVGTPSGVFKVNDVRRKPVQERWSTEKIKGIVGRPGAPIPGQTTRRIPAFSRNHVAEPAESRFVQQPRPESEDPSIRNWKIYKSDIQNPNIGPSPNCPGCIAAMRNRPQKPHTAECRRWIFEIIRHTEEGAQRIACAEQRAMGKSKGDGAGATSSRRRRKRTPPSS